MKTIGVIPARYRSTRLPFKLLRNLQGKTLLEWTWRNALSARSLDRLVIACDDRKIEETAKGFGAEVVLTSDKHLSGTDRIAEAVKDLEAGIVVNIQADEPLIECSLIDRLAAEMRNNPDLVIATAKVKIRTGREDNPNIVKVICDRDNFALYFSRYAIPYYRIPGVPKTHYKHLGIYAYTKEFLCRFKDLPCSFLEEAEKLEQLRVLEAGYRIKVIETDADSLSIDTEEDLLEVKGLIAKKGFL